MTNMTDQALGCDAKALMDDLADPIMRHGLGAVLTSLLSDVQEMLVRGNVNDAHQGIARVKYIIGAQLPKVYATPADVAVHSEVGQLRALYADTTQGPWHALPGRAVAIRGKLLPGGWEGVDVLRGHAPHAREAKRNADFSARMHNAAPALLDAADLVEHVLNQQDNLPRDQRDAYIVDKAQATLSALKKSLT